METWSFGQTGASLPILSFGAQRVVDEEGCSQDQALEILNTALDRGIRCFDTAWAYSRGQSEERLGIVARHRRAEMWIATRTVHTRRDGARSQLEESLQRLQTDHLDEWRLHNVHSFERLDQMTAKGGALEGSGVGEFHPVEAARRTGRLSHMGIRRVVCAGSAEGIWKRT